MVIAMVVDSMSGDSDGNGNGDYIHCHGQFCSLYGIILEPILQQQSHRETSALKQWPTKSFCNEDGPRGNEFEREAFLYYYWYMTNVCSITGINNTERLPLCLEVAICDLIPSLDGIYIPYMTAEERQINNTELEIYLSHL